MVNKSMRIFSISLIIRKMSLKTAVKIPPLQLNIENFERSNAKICWKDIQAKELLSIIANNEN